MDCPSFSRNDVEGRGDGSSSYKDSQVSHWAPDVVVGASHSDMEQRIRTSVGLGDLRKALHSLSLSVASSLK